MVIRRCVLILVTLSLLILLMPACGGDDDNDETTPTTSQTTAPTSAQTITASIGGEPVRIGVITAWSGPAAMSGLYFCDPLIEILDKQLEDMGGILGGRPVEWVRYDTKGQVANAVAGVTKLVREDKVSILAYGGTSPAEFLVVSDAAEREKVLFVSVGPITDVAEKEYTIEGTISYETASHDDAKVIAELLTPKPKTFGFFCWDNHQDRVSIVLTKQKIEAAGIETVHEQFVPLDTRDFSAYLTRLKYEDPDCVFILVGNEQFMAIAKQISGLGGWGDIKVVAVGTASASAKMPGAVGWIIVTAWDPSMNDPSSVKFKEDFEAVVGRLPTGQHMYPYITLLTAIQAIEQAGTDDRAEIARFARSGNLEFDTPMGRQHYGTDGKSILHSMYVQIQEGGVVVPYP